LSYYVSNNGTELYLYLGLLLYDVYFIFVDVKVYLR